MTRVDYRKRYPMGTRASVEIDAQTDEPQVAARGREFQVIFAVAAADARALIAERLRDAGYTVIVKIVDADCEAWFDAEICRWRT